MKIEKIQFERCVTDIGSHISSSTSIFDRGDTRADRRILAAGETNGDGKSTTTSPTLLRFDWWHKRG